MHQNKISGKISEIRKQYDTCELGHGEYNRIQEDKCVSQNGKTI